MSVHFLIAEKDKRFASVVGGLLENSGHKITIANTAEEALFAAEEGGVEFLISDFIVSLNDEIKLISEMRRLEIPVIMLTTHTEAEYVQMAIAAGVVDFICKSEFDSTGFLLRINKNIKKHMITQKTESKHKSGKAANSQKREFDMLLDKVKDIKILSTSVSGMMELLNNDVLSLNEIFNQVSQDAAFSAKIVKVANSPLYRLKSPAKTLEQAIINIGRDGIESLVMGVGLIDNVVNNATGIDRINICKHSLITAVIAKEIASYVKFVDGDLSFLGGLLHSVGMFFLEDAMQNRYVELIQKAIEDGLDLYQLEQSELKLTHAEFGMQVFKRWGFQEELLQTIGYHHLDYNKILELTNIDRILVGVVAVATKSAQFFAMSNMGTEMIRVIDSNLLNFIGIKNKMDAENITNKIRSKAMDLKHILLPHRYSKEDEEDALPADKNIYILGDKDIILEPISIRYGDRCNVIRGLSGESASGLLVQYINKKTEIDDINNTVKNLREVEKFKGRIIFLIHHSIQEEIFANKQDNIFSFKLPMSATLLDSIIKPT